MLKFKKSFFGTEKVILHSKELTRPNVTKQKELGALTNRKIRMDFYTQLNTLLNAFKFEIFAFAIDKSGFKLDSRSAYPELYFMSFMGIYNKFKQSLKLKEYAKISVERRNNILDRQFLHAWDLATISKLTQSRDVDKLTSRYIIKPNVVAKSWSQSGLELADLTSYRLSRHILGKHEKPLGNEVDIQVFKRKKMRIQRFKISTDKDQGRDKKNGDPHPQFAKDSITVFII